MNGVERIAAERQRQIEVEGFDEAHDDEHCFGEICGAASSYAEVAARQIASGYLHTEYRPTQMWRWSGEWWKPGPDPIRNLEKAGALVAAEIDRLLRDAAEKDEPLCGSDFQNPTGSCKEAKP